MSGQTSTNWHVQSSTGSPESPSRMTVKWCASTASSDTGSPEPTSPSLELRIRRCFIKVIDEILFRPLVWLVTR